jgi:regulator of replication initiation timing
MYELTAAISSIKSIGNFAAFLLNAKISTEVTQKATELQSTIITLQNSIMSVQVQNQELLDENNRLKQQLAEAQNWEAEASKYSLKQSLSGCFVYALNNDQLNMQPYHWLCPHCFQDKQKSILQKGGREYLCPRCKTLIDGPIDFPKSAQ